jgi:hypothetical protein
MRLSSKCRALTLKCVIEIVHVTVVPNAYSAVLTYKTLRHLGEEQA